MVYRRFLTLCRNIALMAMATMTLGHNSLYAVPAKPGLKQVVTQSDGSTLTIELKGDEHFHWRTTQAGHPIVEGEDGLYYYAKYSFDGRLTQTAYRVAEAGRVLTPPSEVASQDIQAIARVARSQSPKALAQRSGMAKAQGFPCEGEIRSVVILVEYSDVKFSIRDPHTAFTNQLNEEGYSSEGATGSARDYYHDNSNGAFKGQFDVYGPYTLANTRSYYGGNRPNGEDKNPEQMVWDAVDMANEDGVDFSQYDYDDDGYIDNVFVYYAGHNEAEGGPADSVWPHKYVVNHVPEYDGKYLYVYACTSELRGDRGTKMAGIGTFCHEFGHVFGLYDHYDTDYSSNGYSQGLGEYDIMSSGSYNNNGNTPPLFNAFEVNMIGWHKSEVLTSAQSITLKPIQHQQSYKILTEEEGEYFLIENRNQGSIVWENYIPASGLIISHLDESSDVDYWWNVNGPNARLAHECFKFIVAGNTIMNGYNWSKVPYPYGDNNEWSSTSSPKAESWAKKELDINIVDIKRSGDEDITFKSILRGQGSVNVMVTRTDGFTDSFVGDVIPMSVEVYPAVEDNSVTWSSSDSSIATVDSKGVVTLVGAGAVRIIATYDIDSELEGSLTLRVKDLQGARGAVLSTDGEPLAASSLKFYPVTRSYEGKQAVFTRSSSSATEVKSNALGLYRAELADGLYEVEVNSPLHTTKLEIVEVARGAKVIDFTLSPVADSVADIYVDAYTVDATAVWNPQGNTSFKLTLVGGEDDFKPVTTNECTYELENLKGGSDYTLKVTASTDGKTYNDLYTTEFATTTKRTSMPMIRMKAYDHAQGEILELRTLNTVSTDITEWFVDGQAQSQPKVVLEAGEHLIKAVVTRGKTIYTVTKFVNIK